MKRSWRIVFFAMAIVSLGVFSGFADEAKVESLVRNSSFEECQDNQPAGWEARVWNGEGALELSDDSRTGMHSVMISSDQGGDLSWFIHAAVKPYSTYQFSGWIKTQDLKAISGRGALFNIHNLPDARTEALIGTHDWTKVEMVFETVENDELMINCLFGGWGLAAGNAWYDDLKLECVSSSTLEPAIVIDASQTREPISPYIYGQFIEHLGRCIYGGIWAEMLEDRKFYFPITDEFKPWTIQTDQDIWQGGDFPVLTGSPWKVIGGENIVEMVREKSYTGEQTPRIQLVGNVACGIEQGELALIENKEYEGYAIIAGDASASPVYVSLIWGNGEDERDVCVIDKIDGNFIRYPFHFKSKVGTKKGRLQIAGTGEGSFQIGTASLMPADHVKGFRPDTLALLKELDSPIYRWPGGNFVSDYDWKDGIGNRDKRPPRKNPAWTGIESNDVGIHEFMDLCELLDTEPYIAVNTGLGAVEAAAEEVQYCNGAITSKMGRWRAENGRPEPFRVIYWAVGNEMYGNWQKGHMPLEDYVEKHNRCVELMRAEDPSIQLVGVGAVGNWSETMLAQCADSMDLISEHIYRQDRRSLASHAAQIANDIKRVADAHRKYRQELDSLKGRDIRIAMDEWNYWYGPYIYGELGVPYHLQDALGIAAGLHEYARNSDIYFMANYAQTVNVIGCIKTSKTDACFDATGLALKLYRHEFGSIPVQISGDYRPLDVCAALSADRRTLTLSVVNPTTEELTLDFKVEAVQLAGKARRWRISGDDKMAHNAPGEKPQVEIVEDEIGGVENQFRLDPISVTLFSFPLQ
ncbi:MAG: alpha-L-arabinofuranosidase [Candidatus Omnitrophica bacterium]|nr:alpha-L-arabinofuranosidase [Candidatus Omnitrophota bacterium]